MNSSYLLSIDQGTTGTTILLFDQNGKIKGKGYQSFKQYYPQPGWVEHNPEDIFSSLRLAINKALESARVSSKKIAGIGITNQRETALVWDPKEHRSLHRAIVWQCRRTTPIIEHLKKQKGLENKIKRITGLPLDPYFSASKIKWFLENVPNLKKKTRKGRAIFGTVDSYLLWRLTGGDVHATDWTNASRTQLFNIKSKKWDNSLLELFGVPDNSLPKALPSKTIFGTTRNLDFLPDGIPIAAILGDQQAALYGQSCYKLGETKNTYGTGSFFMVQLGDNFFRSKKGFLTTLAINKKGESTFALEGSIFVAGAAVQWIRDELGWVKTAAETERIARQFRRRYPDPYVFMVPAFVGLGAPYWNPNARGAFVGLTRGTTREEMVTAALESLAYPVTELAHLFEKETNANTKILKVDGGASQNNYLMQLQADLLGIKVERPAIIETTALGAAKLAGVNLNFWKKSDIVENIPRTQFLPKISKTARCKLLKQWEQAVRRVL